MNIEQKYKDAILASIKTDKTLAQIAEEYDIPQASYITTYRSRYLPHIISELEETIEKYVLENKTMRNQLDEAHESLSTKSKHIDFLQQEIDGYDLSKSKWIGLLPIAILVLTTASVLSVGTVLTELFHQWYIGYSVAFVFCNAPLILIMLKRVGLTWGKIAILLTLVFEITCNHYNILMGMKTGVYNDIANKFGCNPYYLSMFIATGLSSLACLLEYLWLKEEIN